MKGSAPKIANASYGNKIVLIHRIQIIVYSEELLPEISVDSSLEI